MTRLLSGKETAQHIDEKTKAQVAALKESGKQPTLALIRLGSRPDDLAYESSLMKKAAKLGITVDRHVLEETVSQEELEALIGNLNKSDAADGILVFRPLPRMLDAGSVNACISPEKDVDGSTLMSAAGVFTGNDIGYPPCTADAVVRLLEDHGVPISGRKVAVVGRSLVVGRPLSLMLMRRNATVTLCHTGTVDLKKETREADIIVSCTGHIGTIGRDHVREGQTIIDVGINFDAEGHLVGDVLADDVNGIVEAMTPIAGGVGAVTTAVLISHVVESASKRGLRYE